MSEKEREEGSIDQVDEAATPTAAKAEDGESVEEAAQEQDEMAVLTTELDESKAQAAEYLDGWQRARAEFANYRRRQEQRQKQMGIETKSRVLGQLLPVVDDLDRAFQAVPDEIEEDPWFGGLSLVWQKLSSILEKNGVSVLPVEPGDAFDPNRHEALTHEPNDEFDEGTIIQVVQRGYEIDDSILRPALVRVSSGSIQADKE